MYLMRKKLLNIKIDNMWKKYQLKRKKQDWNKEELSKLYPNKLSKLSIIQSNIGSSIINKSFLKRK